jgi:hypothetical protein
MVYSHDAPCKPRMVKLGKPFSSENIGEKQMAWGQTGWDALDEVENEEANRVNGVRDFWVTAGKKKRIVILDDHPFPLWEHGLWALTKQSSDREVCLLRNKIDEVCPLCEITIPGKDGKSYRLYPSFIGAFTVIDCGDVLRSKATQKVVLEGYKSKKGQVFQFNKKMMRAKKGSKDKPGMLPYIRRRVEDCGGSMLGTVWDCFRPGEKSEAIGSEWSYVGRIDVSSTEAMLKGLVEMDGSPLDSVSDKLLEGLDNLPLPYEKIFVPKTVKQLERRYARGVSAPKETSSEPENDEDIPF